MRKLGRPPTSKVTQSNPTKFIHIFEYTLCAKNALLNLEPKGGWICKMKKEGKRR